MSHSDPPTVEPVYMEKRQGLGRPVVMTCKVLRAHPSRVLRFEWLLSNRLLHAGAFDAQRDETEYTIRSLSRDGWGEYTCNVINEAGAGKCTFQVTGKVPNQTFLSCGLRSVIRRMGRVVACVFFYCSWTHTAQYIHTSSITTW